MLESPLGLFPRDRFGAEMEDRYGIPRRALTGIATPWALKRLKEYKGDLSKFQVVRIMPSVLNQIGIVKTEPGDENTQDISSLVGKVDLRMLEQFAQDDPDAYSYSGALCLGSARCVEFVEMFKAPLKVLNPILTATQEGNFKGTEALPALPFNGFIMAHSNEAEWLKFRNNKDNEAFIDRVYLVKVPYCLRVDEEVRIYEKMLNGLDAVGGAVRAADAAYAGRVLRALAAGGAGKLIRLQQAAFVQRRDSQGCRSAQQEREGVSRRRRHAGGVFRPVDALGVQDDLGRVQSRPERDRG